MAIARTCLQKPGRFSGLLFAALALLPMSAQAQCAKWDAGGPLTIDTRGQEFSIALTLEQNDQVITGTADATQWTNSDREKTKELFGTVDGTIEGNHFSIQIFWDNDQTGIYNATVLPSGRLDGEAYEKGSPNVRYTWHSEGVLKCPPPPPPPRPIKSSGKAHATSVDTLGFLGTWQTVTGTGGHFAMTFQMVGTPLPGQMLQFVGAFVNTDGAHQYDGTIQGSAMYPSGTLIFTYSQPGIEAAGTGTFYLSNDGKSITGNGVSMGKDNFTWNGTR